MIHPSVDPGKFKVCPPYMESETGQSYLARLTSYFGCRSIKEFCRDYELDLAGIQHGEHDALRTLAYMTGADADRMISCTPRRLNSRFMELAGQQLNARNNPRHRISICPLCALEDVNDRPGLPLDQVVYGRREWTLGTVEVCHLHGIRLVTHIAPTTTLLRIDVGYETSNLLENLRSLPQVPMPLDDYQRYVLSRIGTVAAPPSPLLDGLPLMVVTQLCHAAGRDVLRKRGEQGADGERRKAGFEALGHGIAHFEQSFLSMRNGLKLSEMAASIFPRLIEYLMDSIEAGRALDSFIDAFVDVCFRNLPYAPGIVLLGRTCRTRTLHDFRSAMAEYDIPRHHLEAFVEGTPDLTAYLGGRRQDSLIRASVADGLFPSFLPTISSSAAAQHIGRTLTLPRKDIDELVDADILHPELGAATTKIPPIFSTRRLEQDIEAFWRGFDIVNHDGPDMLDFNEMSQRMLTNNGVLWSILGARGVRRIGRVPGELFWPSIRMPANDVFEAIVGSADVLTTIGAAKLIGLYPDFLRKLAAGGYIERRETATIYPTGLSPLFDRRTLEQFGKTYMSVSQVYKVLPRRPRQASLANSGLKPAIEFTDKAGKAMALYERAAVTAYSASIA